MEILALITARGGSKSIPKKNIHPLLDKPLLAYTCEAALSSHCVTRTVLSTDDEEIATASRAYGVEVPFMRPTELARDDTPTLPVILHALHTLENKEGYQPAVIVLLQPTSPLRQAHHIDEAVTLLIETGADSVVSVVEVPHPYNPISVMRIEKGQLIPFIKDEGTRILRRQDKPKVYARNGPAILAIPYHTIIQEQSLFGEKCIPYIMDRYSSIDIDTEEDLAYAEFVMKRYELYEKIRVYKSKEYES
jgi:CMP-N-acetylneuraminic acid synthetase